MSTDNTYISAFVAQFPISLNIEENLNAIMTVLTHTKQDDLVILPEGALSGYAEDPNFLHGIDKAHLAESLKVLKEAVSQHQVHLVFGSCVYEASQWYNAGLYYGPHGDGELVKWCRPFRGGNFRPRPGVARII